MAPPNPVLRTGSPTPPVFSSPSAERKELLKARRIFVDPSNQADQFHLYKKWEDDLQDKPEYQKLSNAIRAIELFISRDLENVPAHKLKKDLNAWVKDPNFSKDPIHQIALTNIQQILRQFQTEDNQEQAKEILELGVLPELKVPEKPKREAPKVPEKKLELPNVIPQGWRLNAISTRFHFADDTFRKAPSVYTLGTLPSEGFGQNQSSNYALSAGFELNYRDYGLFFDGYFNDAMPVGTLLSASSNLDNVQYSAKFKQAGIRLGMVEHSETAFLGKRFEGWNIGLSGKKRVGFGLGGSWCTEVNGKSNTNLCTGKNFQFSILNESDFLTVGYKNFELSFGVIPLTVYINSDDKNGLPDSNRLPLDISLSYYINKPYIADKKPHTVAEFLQNNETVTNAQITFSLLNILTNSVRINWILRNEIGAQSLRIKSLQGDTGGNLQPDKTFGLGNALSMVNGVIGGGLSGAMAYRLQRELRHGSKGQRGVLGAALAAEFAANLIALLATPGLPSQQDFSSGKTDGISNIQARVYRMSTPLIGVRNVLTLFGAFNVFGDLNKAITEPATSKHGLHFLLTHGGLFLGGLALALTSGDQSGTGFLGKSIIGDTYPNPVPSPLLGTQYDYSAQNGRLMRLFSGSMLAGYSFSALTQWVFGKYKYNELKANSVSGISTAGAAKGLNFGNDLQLKLNTDARSYGVVGLEGRF